jgi:hypothetical protein
MPRCFPEHKLYTSLVVLDPETRYRSIEELLGMHFLHMNLVNEKTMRKSRKARHTGNDKQGWITVVTRTPLVKRFRLRTATLYKYRFIIQSS